MSTIDSADHQNQLWQLAERIEAGGGGRFRPSAGIFTRIAALTAGQVIVWESARFEPQGAQLGVEIVVFTDNAVVRAVRKVEGSNQVVVTAFPRAELRGLSVTGGDDEDWGDARDPFWPPHGRILAAYESGVTLSLPLIAGTLPTHVRTTFGQFLPSLFADLGRRPWSAKSCP